MSDVTPCIVCGKELKSTGSGSPNHAHGANEFCSRGQYGSTEFDPMTGDRLAVNICDSCLVEAQKKGRVLFGLSGVKDLSVWVRPHHRS